MPVPIVAIEISAPAPLAPAEVQSLVAACNHAASGARCVQAQSDEIDETPAAVAIVAWQGEQIARLEVGVRSEGSTRWTTRKLEFRDGDELPERWRTIGFVIGTIVGQSSPEPDGVLPVRPPPAAPAPARKSKSQAVPPPATSLSPQPDGQTTGTFALEGTGSPVDTSGPWLAGARLRGAIGARAWPILASSSIGYAWQLVPVESIRAEWLTVTLGARFPLLGESGRPALGITLEALLRQQRFSSVLRDGDRDEGQRWLGGAQLALDAAWEVAPHIWASIGAGAFVLEGTTNIVQFGEEVEEYRHSMLGADGSLGASYRW